MSRKTEDIKFRCEPSAKNTMIEFADHEGLELSDVMRRIVRDYIRDRRAAEAAHQRQQAALKPGALTHA